jgi:hypothetical protein
MDPKNQQQPNPKTPISEVLKQEQSGFVPSAPKLNDLVAAIGNMHAGEDNSVTMNPVSSTIKTNPVPNNSVPESEESQVLASQTRIIKTYRSDVAEAIKSQQQSVAKIAIAEDKQRRERKRDTETVPKKKFWLPFLTIVLIILGAVAIPTIQYILNQKKQEVLVSTEKTIVPFDRQEIFTLNNATRDDLIGAINKFQTKPSIDSTIEYIKILENIQDVNKKTVTQKIGSNVFAGLIGPNMSSALARSFDSDYMYGTEDSDNPKLFILFKTSSYQQTFANMLRWETKMISDLTPILNISTDAVDKSFVDQIVINKDIRAITASDGTIIFLYGFLDNQTLVITTSPQTFKDINSRYIVTHFVQ